MAGIFDPGIFDSGIFDTPPSGTLFTRTATDTTSASESVARTAATKTRTVSDTTSLSESIGRRYSRTATDTTAVSESVRKTYRATDFTTVSDLLERAAVVYHRTAADSIPIGTTSVSAIKSARTATDTQTTSDSITRLLSLHRTLTDSIPIGTTSIQRIAAVRTATDTLTTSDSLVRGSHVYHPILVDNAPVVDDFINYTPLTPHASFTPSVSSGEEPLRVLFVDTSGYNPTSWLWDFGDGTTSTEQNPYHIFAAGTWTVTLTVTNATGSNTTTTTVSVASSTIFVPPGFPRTSYDVVIKIDGDDVTDYVRPADAIFTASVNGFTGQCKFAVRDILHDKSFHGGEEIELWIAGILYWFGYLFDITRQYSFEVDVTTDPSEVTRWYLIEGWDVNVLLTRRVPWNIAHPTQVLTPPSAHAGKKPGQWAAGTGSKATVGYILKNYTLLPSDGVTFDEIADIGSPNADVDLKYAGFATVSEFLTLVNSELNGIFYLRPNKSFVFRDVEVATNPYVISDHPTGAYGVGPRDFHVVSDATEMVNDAMVWGIVQPPRVFSRKEDSASIALHGRWQSAEIAQMFHQASVDHRATAIVEGNSPTRHGAKDDRIAVEATVYQPLFQLGDVVRVEQLVFDENPGLPFDDVDHVRANLPIRQMEITFPAMRHPKWRFGISQEIDTPWNTVEFPPFPPIPPIEPPPPPPPPPCITGDCGIGLVCGDYWNWNDGRGDGLSSSSQWQVDLASGQLSLGVLADTGSGTGASDDVQFLLGSGATSFYSALRAGDPMTVKYVIPFVPVYDGSRQDGGGIQLAVQNAAHTSTLGVDAFFTILGPGASQASLRIVVNGVTNFINFTPPGAGEYTLELSVTSTQITATLNGGLATVGFPDASFPTHTLPTLDVATLDQFRVHFGESGMNDAGLFTALVLAPSGMCHGVSGVTGCVEEFGRTTTGGLGTSEFDGTPAWSANAQPSMSSTDGAKAILAPVTSPPSGSPTYVTDSVNLPMVISSAVNDPSEILIDFVVNGDQSSANQYSSVFALGTGYWVSSGLTNSLWVILSWGGTRYGGSINITDATGSSLTATATPYPVSTDVRGIPQRMRLRIEKTSSTQYTASVKIWKTADSEPTSWTVQRVANINANFNPTSWTKLSLTQSGLSPHDSELDVDRIEVIKGCTAPTGSGGLDPGCFDATAEAHYYFFNFTFTSDGCGSARGVGYGQTLFAQANHDLIHLNVGETWTCAMGVSLTKVGFSNDPGSGYDYHPQFGLGSCDGTASHLVSYWGPFHIDSHEVDIVGYSGPFTVAAGREGDWSAVAEAASWNHEPHTTQAYGWFDPPGWSPPVPAPCQSVYDMPIPIGGTSDSPGVPSAIIYQVAYAYVPGSLRVFVNKVEVTTFTESNPASGQFTYTGNLTSSDQLTVTYIYAGNAEGGTTTSFVGPLCEVPTIVNATTATTTYAIGDGTARIWLDGRLLRPRADYTITYPNTINWVDQSVSLANKPWICYDSVGGA